MKKLIDLDRQTFAAAGMEFAFTAGDEVLIVLPNNRDTVRARLTDGKVELYPRRSSMQREVLKLLGAL
jgi:hypothetical protein